MHGNPINSMIPSGPHTRAPDRTHFLRADEQDGAAPGDGSERDRSPPAAVMRRRSTSGEASVYGRPEGPRICVDIATTDIVSPKMGGKSVAFADNAMGTPSAPQIQVLTRPMGGCNAL